MHAEQNYNVKEFILVSIEAGIELSIAHTETHDTKGGIERTKGVLNALLERIISANIQDNQGPHQDTAKVRIVKRLGLNSGNLN